MSLRPHTLEEASTKEVISPGRSIPNCLYQYSTHEAYIGGAVFHGPKVSMLPSYGDYAFCLTPSGNPIAMIDSNAYRFDESNKAYPAFLETRLALAMTCLFTPENRFVSKGGDSIDNLRQIFAKGKFPYDGRNNPVPFAVRGAFRSVTTTEGETTNVQGTVFGFAVPKWMESIGGPGIRCCFRSGCHSMGGEVKDFSTISGTFVDWAISDHLRLGLPHDEMFETIKLPLNTNSPGEQKSSEEKSNEEETSEEKTGEEKTGEGKASEEQANVGDKRGKNKRRRNKGGGRSK